VGVLDCRGRSLLGLKRHPIAPPGKADRIGAPLPFYASQVTARLKSVDDLELLMNVLESNRAFFVKNDRLAAEVLTLT
jgi:hypothetical protein